MRVCFTCILDYAIEIFHDVLKHGKYTCYLRGDCRLPMMYIDDCLRSLLEFMQAPTDSLSTRFLLKGVECFDRIYQ